jgi:hypothetical protein
VKVDQLPNPLVAVERLIMRCDASQLSAVYEVGTFRDAIDFVHQVGIRRGRVRQGGVIDEDETARIVLQDWNDGRIGYYTLPPASQFNFGRSAGAAGADDSTTDCRVVSGLTEGLTLDGLPTFHLSKVTAMSHRKRAKLFAEYENDEGDEEEEEDTEDEDDVISSDDERLKRKPRKR